ncbi:hypothetical protein SAMN05444483_11227 [Salegentibacter echinorum]|uniref:Uncharacterized protein n=1 Tax=Salegentibacter echinorum TaxID=1073325 RepID=A0A1M5JSF6_SALEC|nr:hypothetical protein SAMN05444483_11227 [Salegentibacter echinorum]
MFSFIAKPKSDFIIIHLAIRNLYEKELIEEYHL